MFAIDRTWLTLRQYSNKKTKTQRRCLHFEPNSNDAPLHIPVHAPVLPTFPDFPTSIVTLRDLPPRALSSLITMPFTVFFRSTISPLVGTSICWNRSPNATAFVTFANETHLIRQVCSELVHHARQFAPRAFHVQYERLAAEFANRGWGGWWECFHADGDPPFHTDFLRYASNFLCELSEFIDL
jgi:hypothetical protein